MRRDEQILAAAERLFFERSFSSVGVDEIGAEAGITGASIYRHFASKDEILVALIDRATDELLIRLGPPQDDPLVELQHLVTVHVEFAHAHPQLAGIWAREDRSLTAVNRRRMQRRQYAYVQRWISCIATLMPGRGDEDVATVVRAVTALLVSDATRMRGARSSPRVIELLAAMAIGAVQPLTVDANDRLRNP